MAHPFFLQVFSNYHAAAVFLVSPALSMAAVCSVTTWAFTPYPVSDNLIAVLLSRAFFREGCRQGGDWLFNKIAEIRTFRAVPAIKTGA